MSAVQPRLLRKLRAPGEGDERRGSCSRMGPVQGRRVRARSLRWVNAGFAGRPAITGRCPHPPVAGHPARRIGAATPTREAGDAGRPWRAAPPAVARCVAPYRNLQAPRPARDGGNACPVRCVETNKGRYPSDPFDDEARVATRAISVTARAFVAGPVRPELHPERQSF